MGNETQSQKIGSGKAIASPNDAMKPKCPYYPDAASELACPYFMMSNCMGPMGMGYANQGSRPNWVGMASLILGIISISMCWLGIFIIPAVIFIITSILAIIFSGFGLRAGGRPGVSRTTAWAGLILGILALSFTIAFVLLRFYLERRYYY